MRTTLDLIDAAITKTGMSQRELCRHLGVSVANLAMARQRGSVSPIVAGQLAALLDLNVEHWMAVSVLESTPKSRVTDSLRRVLHTIA
jgi:plasmid maintenance system antidote protein VapI